MTPQAAPAPFDAPAAALSRFLAFDTSTDVMSVALTDGVRVWQHSGPGGAKASTTLIPAVLALLQDAGMALGDLDAIAFGQGPGSFTGLRTACAVAQGLAFGARGGVGLPVLPIPTLLALAEEARATLPAPAPGAPLRITALLDARMDEMYAQTFEFCDGKIDSDPGNKNQGVRMIRPENFTPEFPGSVLAGNVFAVYAQRLIGLASHTCVAALPTATAMLRLAPALAASGACVAAEHALPLYVRDKVAQTTAERAVAKAAKVLEAAASAEPAAPALTDGPVV